MKKEKMLIIIISIITQNLGKVFEIDDKKLIFT